MTLDASSTLVLTQEYCKEVKNRLMFYPASVEEAKFIVEQLQGMGFNYYRTEFETQLANALTGSLYLDNDKTIMVSTSKPEGIACTVDNFRQFFLPSSALQVDPRLTDGDCRMRTLAFFPRNTDEARGVLAALLKAGATPREESENLAAMMARAVVQGVLVREGRISFRPNAEDLCGAEICTAADLGVSKAARLSPEQATILAAFNEMATRMEQMSARLARLEEEVLPKSMPKTPLPKPKR